MLVKLFEFLFIFFFISDVGTEAWRLTTITSAMLCYVMLLFTIRVTKNLSFETLNIKTGFNFCSDYLDN